MELRRDPITQSWVIQQMTEVSWTKAGICPLCPGHESLCPPNLYVYPLAPASWQVRVIPHRNPVYQIEETPRDKLRVFTTRCATWVLTRW